MRWVVGIDGGDQREVAHRVMEEVKGGLRMKVSGVKVMGIVQTAVEENDQDGQATAVHSSLLHDESQVAQ